MDSLYILHVSFWLHLPGPLWLLPDVLSIIYSASIGQYWSRLSAPLPYWHRATELTSTTEVKRKKV